ncbi:hypothetical protein EMIHUDRAFT_110237 [Emiliania huxleyi CCMP1516]|uniref:Ribosomal protein L1 n=2 Tax=Emiliania huxleyi TaxID=2903 RepID=A0A0D3KKU7_EMIH1|nr:hypothetical protein EMIHUDRAFT_110237 [Emiliania huxleyi CCMP1516]EOD36382.1 hypothetical protein EMIHUDRAFT_110237 [Emiliania huxleyi CCMP1516]|eukprot:XP_005788811.1 hypothetical protein EMIHUDRAFT_110237 [Emiliania huxleyi CCMP1516]
MVTPKPSATLSKPKKAAKSVKSKAPAAPVAKEAKRQRAAPLSADAPVKKKKKGVSKKGEVAVADAAAAPRKRKATASAAAAPAAIPAAKRVKKAKGAAAAAATAAAPAAAAASAGASSSGGGGRPKLEQQQVIRAIEALCTHVARVGAAGDDGEGGGSLLSGDTPINLVVATKRMPKACRGAKGVKPKLLPLPHARSLDETEVCLIVKDPQRAVKDACAAEGVTAKVIGIDKLRKKCFLRARARYDFFAADEAVTPLLPKLLGNGFYKSNKLPLPMRLGRKEGLRDALQRAVGGAIVRPTFGTCSTVTVAATSMSPAAAAENVLAAVDAVAALLPGKWGNVQALHLRCPNSVALPIYNSLPMQ